MGSRTRCAHDFARTEEAILGDLIRPDHEAVKTRYQRDVLESVVRTLDGVPGQFRRRLRDSSGVDLDRLAEDAAKAIA